MTLNRWLLLPETSPSGCALFRCRCCGAGPTKAPLATCPAGCRDDGAEVALDGWRYREVRRTDRIAVLVLPWGGVVRVVGYGPARWAAVVASAREQDRQRIGP